MVKMREKWDTGIKKEMQFGFLIFIKGLIGASLAYI